jgi:hypothetical protein
VSEGRSIPGLPDLKGSGWTSEVNLVEKKKKNKKKGNKKNEKKITHGYFFRSVP